MPWEVKRTEPSDMASALGVAVCLVGIALVILTAPQVVIVLPPLFMAGAALFLIGVVALVAAYRVESC